MSGKRRYSEKRQSTSLDRVENQMGSHGPVKLEKSLGKLRQAKKTKQRSPDATGTLTLQHHTIMEIARQLEQAGGEEVVCNIAGWQNRDQQGKYLTVELSPPFAPRQHKRSGSSFLDVLRDDEDD